MITIGCGRVIIVAARAESLAKWGHLPAAARAPTRVFLFAVISTRGETLGRSLSPIFLSCPVRPGVFFSELGFFVRWLLRVIRLSSIHCAPLTPVLSALLGPARRSDCSASRTGAAMAAAALTASWISHPHVHVPLFGSGSRHRALRIIVWGRDERLAFLSVTQKRIVASICLVQVRVWGIQDTITRLTISTRRSGLVEDILGAVSRKADRFETVQSIIGGRWRHQFAFYRQ